MFTKFNKKYKTIFLDPHSEVQEIDEKVNIVLSPTLYWVKKVSLPVKYVREALKLLPSIFEDTIPEGNYSYSAYKSGDEFIVFAYEDKLILDTLYEKGVASANIANIYFAQSELSHLESAVKINEAQSIYVKDGLLILVPCCWIEESGELDLSNITHSKHTITLAQFGHIVDNKSLYKIAAVLVAFISLLSIELFITLEKQEQIQNAKEELFLTHKLKPTMFQNRAMLKKYRALHESQTNLREYFAAILSVKSQERVVLSSISLKDEKMSVTFSGVDSKNEKVLLEALKRKNLKFSSSLKDEVLQLEVKL